MKMFEHFTGVTYSVENICRVAFYIDSFIHSLPISLSHCYPIERLGWLIFLLSGFLSYIPFEEEALK